MRIRNTVLALGTVGSAVAISVLGMASANTVARPAENASARPTPAQIQAVEGALPVLHDRMLSVTDREVLAEVRHAVAGRADFGTAQTRIARRDGAHTLHVVADDDGVCWTRREASGGGGTSCALLGGELNDIASGEVAVAVDWTDDGFRVSALVPRQASDIRLQLADGSTQSLEIMNNTVSTEVHARPVRLSWTTAESQHEHDLTAMTG
jgi:hypothetical protein